MPTSSNSSRYRLADLVLDLGQRRVRRGEEILAIRGLPFAILRVLVEAAPNLVTYDELTEQAWGPKRIVTPESVAQHIKSLRRALGDDAANPRYIESVRGEGYRLVPQVEVVGEPSGPSSDGDAERRVVKPGWRSLGFATASVGVAAAVWLYLQIPPERAERVTPAAESRPLVVVLPFTDTTPGGERAELGIALADDLRDALGDVDGLSVAARRSSLTLTQADTQAIVESLGVDYILDGTLGRDGDRVVIRPQLVDAATGAELWSQALDVPLGGSGATLDEPTELVVMMVSAILAVGEWERFGGGPVDIRALEEVLRFLAVQGDSREAQLAALGHLERAVRHDPQFAQAYAVLFVVYNDVAVTYADREMAAEYRGRARAAIERAVELAPDLPFVQAIAAGAHMSRGEWHEAAALFSRLVEAGDPDTLKYDLYDFYGLFLRSTGRLDDARRHFEYRQRVAPDNVDNSWRLIETYAALGDFEAAFREAERDWQGQRLVPAAALAAALGSRDRDTIEKWIGRMGRYDDELNAAMGARLDDPEGAGEMLRDRMYGAEGASAITLAPIVTWAAYFGDFALALEALSLTPEEEVRGTFVTLQIWRPVMAGVRRLPEFKALVRDVGLVAYWREWGWPDLCRPMGGDDFECD
jgi:DNA-binding winged helix-turn-helix (wHTH) protein/TolB-like protein